MKKYIALVFLSFLIVGCNLISKEKVEYQKTFHKNGKVFTVTPIVEGKAHGIKKEYYDTGAIRLEVPYESGVVQGKVKFYHPDGKLYSETPRVNGLIEGIVRKYHTNGNLLSETPYHNNKVQPGLREFDEKGKLRDPYTLSFSTSKAKHLKDLRVLLDVSISQNMRSIKFYQQIHDEDNNPMYVAMPTKEGVGQLMVVLPEGAFIEKRIVIKAEFVTMYNSRGVVIGDYLLKVSNL